MRKKKKMGFVKKIIKDKQTIIFPLVLWENKSTF